MLYLQRKTFKNITIIHTQYLIGTQSSLNRKKETLGKCPTRQLFYKYTKPKAFPKH
jgi:hypothetical protein